MFIAGIISAGLGVASAMATAGAQANAAEYNAKIENINAGLARQEGQAEKNDKRIEMRRHLGAIRAAYGGAGLDFSGSPLDVLEDTAIEYSWDVAKIGYKSEVRAVGHENQAKLFEMEADAAQTAGFLGAGTALIGGFTNMFQQSSGFGQDLGAG